MWKIVFYNFVSGCLCSDISEKQTDKLHIKQVTEPQIELIFEGW